MLFMLYISKVKELEFYIKYAIVGPIHDFYHFIRINKVKCECMFHILANSRYQQGSGTFLLGPTGQGFSVIPSAVPRCLTHVPENVSKTLIPHKYLLAKVK